MEIINGIIKRTEHSNPYDRLDDAIIKKSVTWREPYPTVIAAIDVLQYRGATRRVERFH